MPTELKVALGIAGALAALSLGFIFAPFTVISAGSVGVVRLFGDVYEEPLESGFHIVSPLVKVAEMSTQIEVNQQKFNCASADMQDVVIDMILNYRLSASHAPQVYQQTGYEYYSKLVIPAAAETLKAEIALHNASDILKERPGIKVRVQENIQKWLRPYGIEIAEASLADINFSNEYENAIEAKQLEEQRALQKTYMLQQAEMDARIATAKAKGEADAKVMAAQGDAESLKLRGAAEADYNHQVAQSLTPPLLAAKYFERWDGKLPVTMLGESAQTLIRLPETK